MFEGVVKHDHVEQALIQGFKIPPHNARAVRIDDVVLDKRIDAHRIAKSKSGERTNKRPGAASGIKYPVAAPDPVPDGLAECGLRQASRYELRDRLQPRIEKQIPKRRMQIA